MKIRHITSWELRMSVIAEVGCRKCGKGSKWKIFSNGAVLVKAECGHCGHTIEFDDDFQIKTEKDHQVFGSRFF